MLYYILHLRLYEANEIAFDLPLSDVSRAKKKETQSSHETHASAKDGSLYIPSAIITDV